MGGQGRRMDEEPVATATAVATPERTTTIAGGPLRGGEDTYKGALMHGKKRFPRAHGELATSGMAFWSLLASVLALAIAAQYALIVAGGARGAAHYAHDKWLATRSYAQHAGHSASQVMHGAPHWAWASADIGHPAEALMKRARGGVLRWRAWPWNWLRSSSWSYGDTSYYDAPHGAGDTLWTRLFWKRRPACDPPIKYGNWARVAASHARYGACETAQWSKAHLWPFGRAQQRY